MRAFADVFPRDAEAFVLDVVDVEIIADRPHDAVAKTVLVRAAGVRADAVDVTPHVFVGRFAPAEDALDPRASLVLFDGEDLLVNGPLLALGGQLFQKAGDPLGMHELDPLVLRLIDERDPQAAVNVRDVLQVLADDFDVELHAAKDFVVGSEEDGRPVSAERAAPF